jgi:hypothetical protein
MRLGLRALALSLFLLGLAGAPAAQAQIEFWAEKYPVSFDSTTTEEFVFKTEKGTEIKCKKSVLSGGLTEAEQKANPSTISVDPAYSECSAAGTPIQFFANECEYLLHAKEKLTGKYGGQAEIVCPEGAEMLFEAKLFGNVACRIWLPPQSGLGQVYFTNDPNGAGTADDDLTLKFQLEAEMHYTVEKFIACPDPVGTYEFGTFLGGNTLLATNGGKQVGFQVKGE